MRIFYIIFLIQIGIQSFAQTTGKIVFERRYYWINIMSKLPYMTKDEIERERLTWGKNQGQYAVKYDLLFKDNKSVYQEQETDDNYGYSWKNEKYIVTRDYNAKHAKDVIGLLGKEYLVEGEIPKYKWKILNEIKEIQGYLCMKAETIDPIKGTKITVWFTDKIPVFGGPEGLSGLPGMILSVQYNEDDVTIEAISIQIDNAIAFALPQKIKGKSITREELMEKTKKYIEESIAGKKNPYWQIRY